MLRTLLRRGYWQRLARGIFLTRPDEPTRADWLAVGRIVAGPSAVISGWDAARTFGLGDERPPVDWTLILASDGSHRDVGMVRIRPSKRPIQRVWRPIPTLGVVALASAARAVADTALLYPGFAEVRALVTSAVQRELCTPQDIEREYLAGPRNDSLPLHIAVQDVLAGARSVAEAETADVLRAADLPPFEMNVQLLDAAGFHIATADALWRALGAVLEVDSRRHHFLEQQWRGTMDRHNTLTAQGLSLLHVAPSDVRHRGPVVVENVQTWLRGRAADLGLPFPPPPTPPHLIGSPLRLPFRDQQR